MVLLGCVGVAASSNVGTISARIRASEQPRPLFCASAPLITMRMILVFLLDFYWLDAIDGGLDLEEVAVRNAVSDRVELVLEDGTHCALRSGCAVIISSYQSR